MRFGIFYEHQLPRPWAPGDEGPAEGRNALGRAPRAEPAPKSPRGQLSQSTLESPASPVHVSVPWPPSILSFPVVESRASIVSFP